MDYTLGFTEFMSQHREPSRDEFANWNRRGVLIAITNGDSTKARVYATELVRWSRPNTLAFGFAGTVNITCAVAAPTK
jgi:hypothetical protein